MTKIARLGSRASPLPLSPPLHSCRAPGCGRVFARAQHLSRHRLVHSGERPYPCPECPRRFSRSDELIRHGRVMHGPRQVRRRTGHVEAQDTRPGAFDRLLELADAADHAYPIETSGLGEYSSASPQLAIGDSTQDTFPPAVSAH